MITSLTETLRYIELAKIQNPQLSKPTLEKLLIDKLRLRLERSVYCGENFALRISEVKGASTSFSNVVLSLSALLKYDNIPFVVCIVRDTTIDFLIANTSFLKKISHSSQQLREDNIKGSFLGHDIMSEFEGVKNNINNISRLFSYHKEISFEENIKRIVASTSGIEATGTRFEPSIMDTKNILNAPEIFYNLVYSNEYVKMKRDLVDKVMLAKNDILDVSIR